MSEQALLQNLADGTADFADVISHIDKHYDFQPTAFRNGETYNEAGSNNGSCKIFAFGKLKGLSQQDTLNAFGDFYRVDVLQHPNGDDHANIRNFIQSGWDGIAFEGEALTPR